MNEHALKAQQTTLWERSFESDACGMGFVAQLDGEPSHTLIDYALTMLTRMNHRGGTGAEPDTGDGAGMLLAMPDEFFQAKATEAGLVLPSKGDYAVAQLYLPQDIEAKSSLLAAVNYTNDFFGLEEDAWYLNATYTVPFADTGFGGVASVGYTKADDYDFSDNGSEDDNYVDWKVGVTYSVKSVPGLSAELAAVGTNIDANAQPYKRGVETGAVFTLNKTF